MALPGGDLSPREKDILHLIVRAYIETREPVGSRTLSRMRHLPLSAATIRNVMADLSDDRYLTQPHTSAGRIPTDRAFRDFAGAVSARPLPAADNEHIFNRMNAGESLEERVAIASRVLTEMTRNVGIAAAMPSSSQGNAVPPRLRLLRDSFLKSDGTQFFGIPIRHCRMRAANE